MILRAQITFDPDFGAQSRVAKRVLKASHEAGARFWHSQLLPRHFEHGAGKRYDYGPRDPRRPFRKKTRGKALLVVSGVTRDRATATIQVRAYPTRATLTLYTPSYIPQRPRPPSPHDLAAEIFRIRADEQREIEAVEQATAEKQLRELKETRTVQIG